MGPLWPSLAAAGRREEATALLAEIEARATDQYVSAYARAVVHRWLGDRSRTLDWLEKAAQERSWYLPFIGVDPDFDPYRDDLRFQKLLRAARLDSASAK